jgi:hypothetical protein
MGQKPRRQIPPFVVDNGVKKQRHYTARLRQVAEQQHPCSTASGGNKNGMKQTGSGVPGTQFRSFSQTAGTNGSIGV